MARASVGGMPGRLADRSLLGALVTAQYPPRGGRGRRFYKYNGLIENWWPGERAPQPQVVYLTLERMGSQEVKRLLLAQLV